ncbi:hypothetical protein [Ectobacillus ponti]|nr:hypothetical protein [Ectobacillus ponti]
MFSQELYNYISDADLHTKMDAVEYSTSPREVITVADMLRQLGRG